VKLRNTLAHLPNNKNISISPHPAKLPTGGLKCKGYTSEAFLFCFLAVLRLDISSALRFWCLSVENGMVC
jgi:hypothetical protein